jgi:phosphohistidine phosphatase
MPARRLVLIRHAEAASAVADADRPLTERGGREATELGTWLADAGLQPDRVVVSTARRAQQTWDRAAEALADAPRPLPDGRLYDNTLEVLLEVIGECADDVGTLVVVGHNPSVGQLARVVLGDPDEQGTLAGFPAATAAVFELSTSFDSIEPGSATLTDVRLPGN